MTHEKTEFVFTGMSNAKHQHNTRFGRRYFNHWFHVYRCPKCGRMRPRKSRAKFCRGTTSDDQW